MDQFCIFWWWDQKLVTVWTKKGHLKDLIEFFQKNYDKCALELYLSLWGWNIKETTESAKNAVISKKHKKWAIFDISMVKTPTVNIIRQMMPFSISTLWTLFILIFNFCILRPS